MRKNCQLHFWIESDLLEKLKKESDETNINLPELCRRKLRDIPRLDRLEMMLTRLEKALCLSRTNASTRKYPLHLDKSLKNSFSRKDIDND